jgi:isopentenyldiphosphate isomerase
MGYLDVVDDDDNVIGREPFEVVRERGLRRRTVNIFLFQKPDMINTLITQRSAKIEAAPLKLQLAAGGHVDAGESYEAAALRELREELFHETVLPSGLVLVEIDKYKNDKDEKREITKLYRGVYPGPFSPDPEEVERAYWQNVCEVMKDIERNPGAYTNTIRIAMSRFTNYLH